MATELPFERQVSRGFGDWRAILARYPSGCRSIPSSSWGSWPRISRGTSFVGAESFRVMSASNSLPSFVERLHRSLQTFLKVAHSTVPGTTSDTSELP